MIPISSMSKVKEVATDIYQVIYNKEIKKFYNDFRKIFSWLKYAQENLNG